MRVLKFDLKGKTAFFKSPEVNLCYFTYGNIHKPVLLGIFGAIMGYKGYNNGYDVYPEYYERLQHLKVSIIPGEERGVFDKKFQNFNNSVGYASQEQGGNLIVREQWLENPKWTIYVSLNSDESLKLADMIKNRECVYMPYLGKNDHPAVIENVEILSIEKTEAENQRIHSLAPADDLEFDWDDALYRYEEYLPSALTERTNQYQMKKFVLTDAEVIAAKVPVYQDGGKNIVFY
ncbi:type I-B CRISPR-associated protein Cas5b [Anaerostipes butyraticus]|uniref:Type I-B CRISPR-associated protein Cas5 n=1 Tax=Anaerostipes butyraticus TaxID=645466 RepID=A0A916Q7I4_9FIRM|nr:type I-B CRISPR-associated protein Cas5b [Anaerostipes butyraticus]GFO85849.1 hypothetical protein ANBU17_21960 [Anaerostipes butyraticus]